MAGNAGMGGSSAFDGGDFDRVGNSSRSTGPSPQGAQWPFSSHHGAAGYEHSDLISGQRDRTGSGMMFRNAQDQVRRSPGAFLVGTVIAGFLLQRFLKSSSSQSSDRPYSNYRSDTARTGYGADASLNAERKYGVDTAYAPETSYGTDTQKRFGTSSTGMPDRITDRVRQASENARTKLQASTADAKARLNDMGNLTKTQYYRAKDRVDTVREEQPWLIGALGLAIGAGVGALLSTTRRENELLGGMRDNLLGKAKETALNQVQTVKASAQRFAEITKEEAQRMKEELTATASDSETGTASNNKAGPNRTSSSSQNLH
jgi:ElaB/YqjD/DUF883 family membrane-anchored ribosome-binding protein